MHPAHWTERHHLGGLHRRSHRLVAVQPGHHQQRQHQRLDHRRRRQQPHRRPGRRGQASSPASIRRPLQDVITQFPV
ncbi:hypothetical protein [Azospirillum doebereinerae]